MYRWTRVPLSSRDIAVDHRCCFDCQSSDLFTEIAIDSIQCYLIVPFVPDWSHVSSSDQYRRRPRHTKASVLYYPDHHHSLSLYVSAVCHRLFRTVKTDADATLVRPSHRSPTSWRLKTEQRSSRSPNWSGIDDRQSLPTLPSRRLVRSGPRCCRRLLRVLVDRWRRM